MLVATVVPRSAGANRRCTPSRETSAPAAFYARRSCRLDQETRSRRSLFRGIVPEPPGLIEHFIGFFGDQRLIGFLTLVRRALARPPIAFRINLQAKWLRSTLRACSEARTWASKDRWRLFRPRFLLSSSLARVLAKPFPRRRSPSCRPARRAPSSAAKRPWRAGSFALLFHESYCDLDEIGTICRRIRRDSQPR